MSNSKHKSFTDDQLNSLLSQPCAPKNLQGKLYSNLADQIQQEQAHSRSGWWRFGLVSSLAANITFAVLIISPLSKVQSMTLMDMAYAHVRHETELTGHFISNYSTWLAEKEIKVPPKPYTVDLAKKCLIGLQQAKHVRMYNSDQQTINLLIFTQPDERVLPEEHKGQKDLQYWVKLQPRQGTHVVAFYDKDIPDYKVKDLVKIMFEDNSVKSQQKRQSLI